MGNYWKERYGSRSNEFIEGFIAGVETFSSWGEKPDIVVFHFDGLVFESPLEEVIQSIKEGLGWQEESDPRVPPENLLENR